MFGARISSFIGMLGVRSISSVPERRKGDYDGADKWLRIVVAIGEPPTDARHGTATCHLN